MSAWNLLVFGDDWGAHPSTTQHLVRHLPAGDRVVWVDSIGMRAPRLGLRDARRVWSRLVGRRRAGASASASAASRPGMRVVSPRILPWHRQFHRLNRPLLQREIRAAMAALSIDEADVLVANPVAELYLSGLPVRRVSYLRLDDYPLLPGVDGDLVAPLEAALTARADAVIATARALLGGPEQARGSGRHYLPQGVDLAHFGKVGASPPGSRVLGFFGLLARWLDLELIAAVARRQPDWTLELLGPVALTAAELEPLSALDNIVLRPGVPYAQLPDAIAHWQAAWAPFAVSDVTVGVNPLKLREYLAAGLPSACTPLPEAAALQPAVTIASNADEIGGWLDEAAADTAAARAGRRASVADDGWAARAATLRRIARGEGAP